MPLQIRRGTNAQRGAMTEPLASGELLYTTDTGVLYIGNGTTLGGVPVANLTALEVKNLAGSVFTGGTHSGISYTYDSVSGTIDSVVEPDLSNYDGVIRASSFSGNLVADDSSLMVNSETGSIVGPVDNAAISTDSLTMRGDILPDTTESHDIGSNSLRFKDLYLSGSSLYLGDAVISSTGNAINLPAGSTVGGVGIGTGSGGGGGDFLLFVAADDSTVYQIQSGNTLQFTGDGNISTTSSVDGEISLSLSSNISVTEVTASRILNSSGQIVLDTVQELYQGSVLGNLFAQDSSLAFNSGTGQFNGSFVGNLIGDTSGLHSGNVVGDLTGDVYKSDGQIILDTVQELLQASVIGNIYAQDSGLAYNSGTGQFNGSFVGNLIGDTSGLHSGNVIGDLTGNIYKADGQIMVDTVQEVFQGNLVGNLYAQDSSIAYNSGSGTFVGVTFTGNLIGDSFGTLFGDSNGTHTGDVIGNVTGGVINGTIETGLIRSDDSSSILVSSPINMQTSVVVDGTMDIFDGLTVQTNDYPSNPLNLAMHHSTDIRSDGLLIRRSRGTGTSPTTIINGDHIGSVLFNGFDGTSYVNSSSIISITNNTVSTGVVPSYLSLNTTNSSGSLVESVRISDQETIMTGSFSATDIRWDHTVGRMIVGRTSRNSSIILTPRVALVVETYQQEGFNFCQHHDTADAVNLSFVRTRGTHNSPSVVQTGDDIVDFNFIGWDGVSRRATSGISSTVTGAVSAGVIPSNISFNTTNNSGTLADKMIITSEGVIELDKLEGLTTNYVTFNHMPLLPTYADESAAATAVGTPVNGMMYYDSGASKIKAFAGGVWVALH